VDGGEAVAFAAMAASTALESAQCDAFLDGGVTSCPPDQPHGRSRADEAGPRLSPNWTVQ
jgi:hypothetical protein